MRWLATSVAIAVGLITLLDYFFDVPILDALGVAFRQWTIILTAFALLLGVINLLQVHLRRIIRRDEASAGYSLIVVVTATLVASAGLWFGLPSEPMTWVFENLYVPLQGAFFALVAFFLATAAYRALRARNLETTWMLIAALVVLLGQTPLLGVLTDAREWVLNVPSTAGVRGILIGVALGTLATALRLLIGMDRPYSE
ncbi:MAG: hypothetical protein FJ009_10315 [Chloroflexi bacterium]|nr:hypothetical protein [Chloroflexota bacterium]